jgi:hypothetical protein
VRFPILLISITDFAAISVALMVCRFNPPTQRMAVSMRSRSEIHVAMLQEADGLIDIFPLGAKFLDDIRHIHKLSVLA